jgi:hypothetical protein
VSELANYIHLICAAAARLIYVHWVATWERGYIGLVIRVAKDVQIVHFYYFLVVFDVSPVFE